MTFFEKIPLEITETAAIQLAYKKFFTKKEEEHIFRNLNLNIKEEQKAELRVEDLSSQVFKIAYNPCPSKEIVVSRFGQNASLKNPKYTLVLLDFTNSNSQIFRINIRSEKQAHLNKSSSFLDSPKLQEFENKRIWGSSIAVGKQDSSFHIPLNRFSKFKDFKPHDVKKCFTIFTEYANILLREIEEDLFSKFQDHF